MTKLRILVIFTGGTISCSENGGMLSPDSGNSSLLLNDYAQKDGAVSFDTAQPYFILSENLSADVLETLAEAVKSSLNGGYDGIIATHGTDTLVYTAAYLGLKLGLCPVPVALVSANYPLSDSRSNGFDNFAGAVALIRNGGRGVFVAYKNKSECVKLHRATRVLPQLPLSDSVYSLFDEPYATVENGAVAVSKSFAEDSFPDFTEGRLNGRVLWLRAYPDMAYPDPSGCKAVLLEGYHSGTLNTAGESLREFCKAADKNGVPVYLAGSGEDFPYESKKLFGSLKIKQLKPMSPAAAYMMLRLM